MFSFLARESSLQKGNARTLRAAAGIPPDASSCRSNIRGKMPRMAGWKPALPKPLWIR
jgi:hypothetical protein